MHLSNRLNKLRAHVKISECKLNKWRQITHERSINACLMVNEPSDSNLLEVHNKLESAFCSSRCMVTDSSVAQARLKSNIAIAVQKRVL